MLLVEWWCKICGWFLKGIVLWFVCDYSFLLIFDSDPNYKFQVLAGGGSRRTCWFLRLWVVFATSLRGGVHAFDKSRSPLLLLLIIMIIIILAIAMSSLSCHCHHHGGCGIWCQADWSPVPTKQSKSHAQAGTCQARVYYRGFARRCIIPSVYKQREYDLIWQCN